MAGEESDGLESGGKRIQLSLRISDFGPIVDGKVELKPLTIFVGPNSSGKSYCAMLFYSLFSSLSQNVPTIREFQYYQMNQEPHPHNIFERMVRETRPDFENTETVEISVDRFFDPFLAEILEKRFSDEIISSYGCQLRELARTGRESFLIDIEFDSQHANLACEHGKLRITKHSQFSDKFTVRFSKKRGGRAEIRMKKDKTEMKIQGPYRHEFNGFLSKVLLEHSIGKIAVPCFYLPASRSGVLQVHRLLVAMIVRRSSLIGIQNLEVPRLSGVLSDFISSMLLLPQKEGPFFDLARGLEEELLAGRIDIKASDEYRYPDILFNSQGTTMPLHGVSSTVSELAPLILYLKYLVRSGNVLIIEEPEAHLHLQNQRILAKYLVRLIRRGITLILTTHSDFLIEQLSSFIMLSRVDPEKRVSQYRYSQDDYLNPDEVGTYIFEYDETKKGYRIERTEITEDGISQEEHMRILEALYEETLKLRKDTDLLSTEFSRAGVSQLEGEGFPSISNQGAVLCPLSCSDGSISSFRIRSPDYTTFFYYDFLFLLCVPVPISASFSYQQEPSSLRYH
jgi:predicted ATPase